MSNLRSSDYKTLILKKIIFKYFEKSKKLPNIDYILTKIVEWDDIISKYKLNIITKSSIWSFNLLFGITFFDIVLPL